MNNYNDDYSLEDQEAKAMAKSRNAKIAALTGAGVVAGAGAAVAATHIKGDNAEDDALTSEDLVSGAKAGVEDIHTTHEHTTHHTTNNSHTTIEVHHVNDNGGGGTPPPPPEVEIDSTEVYFDEDGNPIAVVDRGSIDGTDVAFYDRDLNGKADAVWIDENGDHQVQENELYEMDNQTWETGQSNNIHAYQFDGEGNVHNVDHLFNGGGQNENDVADISDIHNDFRDEKTGEYYSDDFADKNPDYNNHGGEQYSAGVESHNETASTDYVDQLDDATPEPAPMEDHGYTAPDYTADNSSDLGGVDDVTFDA